MNKELRMRNPVEDLFVHASHELYSPITSLLMVSSILKNDRDILTNQQEYALMMEVLDKSCNRLLRTTENVILYHKIITGNLVINEDELINPDNVASTTALRVAGYLNRLGDLDIQLMTRPTMLKIPEKLFEIICTEVIQNAFTYSVTQTPVLIKSALSNGQYQLSITDRGVGMDDVELNRIAAFRQFNRGHLEQQGCGLGLTLTKMIVQQIGGVCHITSEKGVGTTIEFHLPVV